MKTARPKTLSTLARPFFAAALAVGLGALALETSADISFAELQEANSRTAAQLKLAEIDAGPVSPTDSGLVQTSSALNQALNQLDFLGDPSAPLLLASSAERTSTLLLYLEAKTQFDTLWMRCVHWAEHASDQTGGSFFPNFTDLQRRLEQLRIGSELQSAPAQYEGGLLPGENDVLQMQADIADLINALSTTEIGRIDTTKRVSSWLIREALDDFSERVDDACGAAVPTP